MIIKKLVTAEKNYYIADDYGLSGKREPKKQITEILLDEFISTIKENIDEEHSINNCNLYAAKQGKTLETTYFEDVLCEIGMQIVENPIFTVYTAGSYVILTFLGADSGGYDVENKYMVFDNQKALLDYLEIDKLKD